MKKSLSPQFKDAKYSRGSSSDTLKSSSDSLPKTFHAVSDIVRDVSVQHQIFYKSVHDARVFTI